MSYVGTIELFSGTEVPENWLLCNGSLLPKKGDFEVLFHVIGYNFGGNEDFFALPNLSGRTPIHSGNSAETNLSPIQLGQSGGVESIVLTQNNIPKHSHPFKVSSLPITTTERTENAQNSLIGDVAGLRFYNRNDSEKLTSMTASSISSTKSNNDEHTNIPPFIAINYIICYQGFYPTPY